MPPRGLKWDDDTIAEHDKLRGTRMKIDEPNTPYHHDEEMEVDQEGGDPSAPRTTTVAGKPGAAAPAGFDFGDALSAKLNKWVDDGAKHEEIRTKEDFDHKRKNHYNEMHAVRAMKAKMAAGDDDDDDDDDE
jgi:protein phosphatase inhibitor 2